MRLAITGSTGNMGRAVMEQLCAMDEKIEHIKLLSRSPENIKKLLKKCKPLKNKTEVIIGSVADENVCARLASDCDYVINMGAVIPPVSDSILKRLSKPTKSVRELLSRQWKR